MDLLEIINFALLFGGAVLIVPCVVFFTESVAAFVSKTSASNHQAVSRPKTTVLVPAHNEAEQIQPVLQTVLQQLSDRDRLVVIADNCHDNTAELARATGATVIEREDLTYRGKGYALDCGMKFIQDDPPEVVVILDGDCIIAPNTIERITNCAIATGRPIQSAYLMEQPENPSLKDNVSMFAIKVKNSVRLLGLNRLGLHCLLTGSGMAFPWEIINRVSLAGSKTTDDMQLTVDLALTGCTPVFCPEARVLGRLMKDQDAASQRSRWEHGHLEMILVEIPRLLQAFIKTGRLSLLALALDLFIPPLSLLVMLWFVAMAIAITAAIIGLATTPILLMAIAGGFLFTGVMLAWLKFGRSDLPVQNLLALPVYMLSKIPIYLNFLIKPQSRWLKTERDLSE
jgi:cellulose synthase/poly-beta-1,6-N-acetylglucosamine synthase-like glycosyltransferase